MKVIDLLNKIANGEELPKKFIYDNQLFILDEEDNVYRSNLGSGFGALYQLDAKLNDEIEILERTLEEKNRIPEKLEDFNLTTYSRDDEDLGLELHYTGVSNTFNDVYFKINEIIDYLQSKGE